MVQQDLCTTNPWTMKYILQPLLARVKFQVWYLFSPMREIEAFFRHEKKSSISYCVLHHVLRIFWLLTWHMGWSVGSLYTILCQSFPRNLKMEGLGEFCNYFSNRKKCLDLAHGWKSVSNFEHGTSQK